MNARTAITKDAGRAPVKKTQRLTQIEVYEVSLVSTPAVPDAGIILTKSLQPQEPTILKSTSIIKYDAAQGIVIARPLVPDREDLQGDVVTKADVEYASHSYLRNLAYKQAKGTGGGEQHQEFDVAYPILSIYDEDGSVQKMYGVPSEEIIPGAWVLGLKVTKEETKKALEKGELTGMSIGCIGERIELAAPAKAAPEFKRGAFRKLIDEMFKSAGYVRVRPTDKSIDFNSSYTMQVFYDECPDMWDALMSAFWSIMYDDLNHPTFESKMAAIEESLAQFATKIRELFGIEKGTKFAIDLIANNAAAGGANEGVLDMQITQEQLDKLIAEAVTKALGPITEKLTIIETEVKKIAEIEKSVSAQPKLEDTDFAKAVTKDLEQMADLVDKLATRVTGSNVKKDDAGGEPTPDDKKKDDTSILGGAKVTAG